MKKKVEETLKNDLIIIHKKKPRRILRGFFFSTIFLLVMGNLSTQIGTINHKPQKQEIKQTKKDEFFLFEALLS